MYGPTAGAERRRQAEALLDSLVVQPVPPPPPPAGWRFVVSGRRRLDAGPARLVGARAARPSGRRRGRGGCSGSPTATARSSSASASTGAGPVSPAFPLGPRAARLRRAPPRRDGVVRLPLLDPDHRPRRRVRARPRVGGDQRALAGGLGQSGGGRVAMSTEEIAVQDAVAGRLRVGRPLSRRTDAALVRAAQRGDGEAVDELFRRHWPAVHRAAWLVVHDAAAAEDIAQEAFLSALRALDRFDRRRPLGPWLHRIVVNRAIDWSRARALRPETAADALPEAAAPDSAPRRRRRHRRRARRPRPRAPRRRRPAPPARLHARARSRRCSTSRAGRSTRACGARSTRSRSRSRRSAMTRDEIDALERALRETPLPEEVAARERARQTVVAAHAQAAPRRRSRRRGSSGSPRVARRGRGRRLPARQRPRRASSAAGCETSSQQPTPTPTPVSGLELPARGRLLVSEDERPVGRRAQRQAASGSAPGRTRRGRRAGCSSPPRAAARSPPSTRTTAPSAGSCAGPSASACRGGRRTGFTSPTAPATRSGSSTATASTT